MRHVVVIGSGPAGYYTAEACQKRFGSDVRVDIIDRLPVPYGLIRTGVAPDHQSIKGVSRRYEATALSDNVRFVGNVTVGQDVSMEELRGMYDVVVLATGAPADRPLGISGDDLPGVIGSAAFVGWYNGHPDFADLAPPVHGPAVVVGAGNVALDVARILAKTGDEFAGSDIVGHALDHLGGAAITRVTILARRGPHAIAMTPKELGELAHLLPVADDLAFAGVQPQLLVRSVAETTDVREVGEDVTGAVLTARDPHHDLRDAARGAFHSGDRAAAYHRLLPPPNARILCAGAR